MSISFGGTEFYLPTESTVTTPNDVAKIRWNPLLNEVQLYRPEISTYATLGQPYARYWRYRFSANVKDHHPRSSRMMFHTDDGRTAIFVRYTQDNTSDSGGIPNLDQPSSITFDFGSSVRVIAVSMFSCFAVPGSVSGSRAATYGVDYSQNNSNWTHYFGGIMANYPAADVSSILSQRQSANRFGIWYGTGRANYNYPLMS